MGEEAHGKTRYEDEKTTEMETGRYVEEKTEEKGRRHNIRMKRDRDNEMNERREGDKKCSGREKKREQKR